jgi:hypothetical protein
MKISRFPLCLIISAVTLASAYSLNAQVAHLTLQSQPGDFIGQGGTFDITYTPANSDFFSAQIRGTVGSPPEPAELLFVLGTVTGGADNTFSLLFFGTDQLGIPIQPGFYPNAERADFASPGHPGLDISFQNRGSNTLTGNFTITDVTFGPGDVIETFAASFEQHSEGAAPALFGTFTYDANAVPEPSSYVLIFAGSTLLAGWRFVARRAGRS